MKMQPTITCALVAFFTVTIIVITNASSHEDSVHLLYTNRRELKILTVSFSNDSNGQRQVFLNASKVTSNLEDVPAIDYSYNENLIFWSDIETEQIKSLRLDTSQSMKPIISHISSGVMSADGLACDWVTKKIYWADSEIKIIEVVHYESKIRKTLFWSDLDRPRAIALVPHRGLMFWTDWGEIAKIERSSMDGDPASRQVIIKDNIIWPNGLTIDFTTESIYWADAKLVKFERADFDGHNRMAFTPEHMKHPFALTVGNEYIFWTDWVTKSVSMCNKTNGAASHELFTEDQHQPNHAIHPMDIYVFSRDRQPPFPSPCLVNNGNCSHLCLLSSTDSRGYTCACPTGIKLLEDDDKTCAPGARDMFIIARRVDLRYVSLDTADHTDMVIPFKGVKQSVAVDFDTTDGRVYWADDEVRAIKKGKLDGSLQEDVIITDISKPEGLAVDWMAQNLYWIDATAKTIEVARTNGSHRKILISESLSEPRAIAVHPFKGYLFWSDWGHKACIERAALDGSMRQIIIDSAALKWPNGIAIDMVSNRIYWCDAHYDVIESASLDGQDRMKLVREVPHPFGLSVFGNWVYWTDWQRRTIERADKNTGLSREILIDHLPDIMGIKATSNYSSLTSSDNSCHIDNGNCSQLCFFMPIEHLVPASADQYTTATQRHICACANEFKLSPDGVSCERNPHYVPRVKPKLPSDNKNPKKPASKACLPDNGGCSHKCEAMKDGRRKCSCPPELILSADQKLCIKPNLSCEPDQFQCKTGVVSCIPSSSHCDGSTECLDGSDEENCTKCNDHAHFCSTTRTCIPASKKCDNVNDCGDGSDEQCCPSNYFNCNEPNDISNRNQCVPTKALCDGIQDCESGHDEDRKYCSGNAMPDPQITPHPPTTYTAVVFICSFVFLAIVAMVFFFRKSNIRYDVPDIVTDITMTRPLNGRLPDHLTNYPVDTLPQTTLGTRCPVGPGSSPALGPFSNGFSNGLVAAAATAGSDQPYDRSNVTGASSTSSSNINNYSRAIENPPPSPVTSTYSSNAASRYSMPMRYFPQRTRLGGPPPTPCSTDVNDESDFYSTSRYRSYNNSHIDPYDPDTDLYPYADPPPTPYQDFSESSPPSPMTERSYCTVRQPSYPNPPPSPEPS